LPRLGTRGVVIPPRLAFVVSVSSTVAWNLLRTDDDEDDRAVESDGHVWLDSADAVPGGAWLGDLHGQRLEGLLRALTVAREAAC